MLRLRHLIKIEQVSTKTETRNKTIYFEFMNKATIESSFENLTQTAKVILPKNLKYKNENIYQGESPLILRGDKVTIYGGYVPNLNTIFTGYISKIKDGIPIEISCEDAMWILKQTPVKAKSWENVSLKTLLEYVIGDTIEYYYIGANLGGVRIKTEITIGKMLNVLKDEYGLFSRIIDGVLYVGLAFYPDLAKQETFLFEQQIIDNDLQYLRKEDVKIQVKGVIINDDNTKFEKTYGDLTGDVRTVFQYGGTKDELDRLCNSFLEQANYTGYYGGFTTFLEPKVKVGDYAVIDSYKVPDRKGTYLIKSVETSIGVDGGRQKIELERKIA